MNNNLQMYIVYSFVHIDIIYSTIVLENLCLNRYNKNDK